MAITFYPTKRGDILSPKEMQERSLRENAALRDWQTKNGWGTKPAMFAEKPGKHLRGRPA